ncbi:lipid-binding SYLF domain-containing protein [Luteirhabdus pelagi]|uniref:lipid-binding SYLF domain-containing protein n=1 Tax=Luteirhabdus pelagi TaxID=2792783 RepID=UPI00193959EA|nr:lipid-binding SYLF domain-containing protein [Luteirhabdus pelagi]
MKRIQLITILALVFSVTVFAQSKEDKKLMKDAEKAKAAFMDKDPNIKEHFSTAEAYVIFPNVGEGALVVGGASGNGVVYESGRAVGMANMKKVDVGAQVGGEAYSEIIFFKNEAEYDAFKDDDFSLSTKASAVLIKEGAAKESTYEDGVKVFVLPKAGLSLEASVGGQEFDFTPMSKM